MLVKGTRRTPNIYWQDVRWCLSAFAGPGVRAASTVLRVLRLLSSSLAPDLVDLALYCIPTENSGAAASSVLPALGFRFWYRVHQNLYVPHAELHDSLRSWGPAEQIVADDLGRTIQTLMLVWPAGGVR
jgi:hypothetical protein